MLLDDDTSDLSDETLIKQLLQTKDDRYFEHLYNRHIAVTYKKCLTYLENEHEAQDVVQKVWIAVYFALPEFRQDATFSTWLYRITVNHCLNFLKSRRHFILLEDSSSSIDQDDFATTDIQIDVTNLLSQLSKDERVLLNLKYVDEMTYVEIAEMLELSVSAIKMRLSRLKQQLRL